MSIALEVQERAVRPRSIRNKLRHEGKVPSIVYGYQIESTPISVDGLTLEKSLRENGTNAVFSMTVDGKKINTLVSKTQNDTFTGRITHVEFLAVDMNEETEVEAEISLVGEAAGVKAGGTLTQNIYSVVVSATPDNLPEKVEIDISGLQIGDSLTVADLTADKNFTIITNPEDQVVSITEAQTAEAATSAEATEPTVIGQEEE